MARRGENIFKRKDGRWEARIYELRENGDKKYRSLYGKSYSEVKAKKEEHYRKIIQPERTDARKSATFSYVSASWLGTVRDTVKESSYTRYHRNVYSYLLPALGKYTVSEIDSALINRFRNDLLSTGGKRGKGLSEKTVADIFSTLKMILSHASEQGCHTVNIMLLHNSRKKKRDIVTLQSETIERLEEILLSSEDRISLGILLTLHTGIRNGELCGLRWGDFDFRRATVRICRTVERIANLDSLSERKTKVIISEPKTDTSRREIPLPKVLCAYLKKHREDENAYLLTGTDKPSEPHTLYIRYERFLRRNGFENYTFHALRHTFATRGIESGFDTKSLSEILGHSDIATTLRYYVHPTIEQKRRQMESLFDTEIRGQKYGT